MTSAAAPGFLAESLGLLGHQLVHYFLGHVRPAVVLPSVGVQVLFLRLLLLLPRRLLQQHLARGCDIPNWLHYCSTHQISPAAGVGAPSNGEGLRAAPAAGAAAATAASAVAGAFAGAHLGAAPGAQPRNHAAASSRIPLQLCVTLLDVVCVFITAGPGTKLFRRLPFYHLFTPL